MIKDAELYKSSIPSQYGGRIASVLNITSKEANKEKFTGSAGIGLVTSKLNLEIPIIKEKDFPSAEWTYDLFGLDNEDLAQQKWVS